MVNTESLNFIVKSKEIIINFLHFLIDFFDCFVKRFLGRGFIPEFFFYAFDGDNRGFGRFEFVNHLMDLVGVFLLLRNDGYLFRIGKFIFVKFFVKAFMVMLADNETSFEVFKLITAGFKFFFDVFYCVDQITVLSKDIVAFLINVNGLLPD